MQGAVKLKTIPAVAAENNAPFKTSCLYSGLNIGCGVELMINIVKTLSSLLCDLVNLKNKYPQGEVTGSVESFEMLMVSKGSSSSFGAAKKSEASTKD